MTALILPSASTAYSQPVPSRCHSGGKGFGRKDRKLLSHPPSQEEWEHTIWTECVEGSAIAPDLFKAAVRILPDLEVLAGYEVDTPLHSALNWRYVRFGRQARSVLFGAAFLNEDGSVWQVKLSVPRIQKDGKLIKYETPSKQGSRPFLPPISKKVQRAIAKRYGVKVPIKRFWEWVMAHPEIPLVFAEGGKKALCLLSQGYVAISLYGVDGGARAKDADGNRCKPYLIPELLPFLGKERVIILAFDQDSQFETRLRVKRAIIRLAGLLQAQGCSVRVATWDGSIGKGVDDLIVKGGVTKWNESYRSAAPLEEWLAYERLLTQLTYIPSRRLHAADLSLEQWSDLPQEGIVAIQAAKGTGKTKAIGLLVQEEKQALVATHRICLGRNLCSRIGVHWRGDLDKVNGRFIHGSGYTLRVGFCVDSFLAIDPEKFRGCVLVIDEVVQVMRHLLTSATCRKESKLPALLSRFHQIMQVARRVLVADADLNNATLAYLQELRGDGQPVYLVQNTFQPEGYPCEFILSPNASAAIARLLDSLTNGKRLFVCTDSKNQSKRLAFQCYRLGFSKDEVLLLNSETVGGEREQAFIANPDKFLAENPHIRVVIASPSLATGVSIESDFFDAVFGIFWGASLTAADMAQGLMRVRSQVSRVVWCAKTGGNFSKISRDTDAQSIIYALKTQTDLNTMLIRASLREDMLTAISQIDWEKDPHLKLFAHIAAETNDSMWNMRSSLLVRLRHEGHQITVMDRESDPIIQAAMKEARDQIRRREAEAIAAAPLLTSAERVALEAKESITPAEQLSLLKTAIADFYCVDEVTPELVESDKSGRRRSWLLALEHQLYPETAQNRDIQALERQMSWFQGLCPWDLSMATLKREARLGLGLDRYLDPTFKWTQYDNAPVAQRARECAHQVKLILGIGNLNAIADTQIVHQLLAQMGVKIRSRWSSSVPGHKGERLRVYFLEPVAWAETMSILQRRAERRRKAEALMDGRSPGGFNTQENLGGDQDEATREQWLEEKNLNDLQKLLDAVRGDPIATAELTEYIPDFVLDRLDFGYK